MKKAFAKGKIDYVMGNFKPLKSRSFLKNVIGLVSLQSETRLGRDPYLASTRSIGFKKKVWKKIGGFPERLYTGEDTKFNLRAKELGFKATFARDAIVFWRPRGNLKKFIKQFYLYGKGDGESGNISKIKERFLVFLSYFGLHLLLITGLVFFMPLFWISLVLYLPVNLIDSIRYMGRLRGFVPKFLNMPPVMFLVYLKRVSYTLGVFRGLFL